MSHTTVPIRDSSQLSVLTARLLVYGPDAAVRIVVLRQKTSWTIGRDPELSDITIEDSGISKRHVAIERGKSPGSWILNDLNSTNGTRVNGRRVATSVLKSNDVIRIGSTLLVLELAEWTGENELTPRSYMGNWLDQQVYELSQRWYPVLVMGETGTGKDEFCRVVANTLKFDRVERIPCSMTHAEALRAIVPEVPKGQHPTLTERVLLVFEDIHTLTPALQEWLHHLLDPLHRAGRAGSFVHIMATSPVVLDELVMQGQFSRKLYGRIAGIAVSIPPLVERRIDILPAVAQALGQPDHRALHPDVSETLLLYRWPGNFDELMTTCASLRAAPSMAAQRNALPRLLREFRHAMDEALKHTVLPAANDPPDLGADDPRTRLPSYEFLMEELVRANHNVSQMARNLQEHRNQVVRWLERHGIKPARQTR